MFVALALTCALTALPSTLASCGLINEVGLTFYGSPDDSSPQSDIVFDCGRGKNANSESMAGGSGTYDDPMSFGTATDNQNLPRCAIIYVPLLRKYFRNEDDCAGCLTDGDTGSGYRITLRPSSTGAGGEPDQIDCVDRLPEGPQTIIVDPPDGLPVDITPLVYSQPSNQCRGTIQQDLLPNPSRFCAGGIGSESTGNVASVDPLNATGAYSTPSTFSTVSAAVSSLASIPSTSPSTSNTVLLLASTPSPSSTVSSAVPSVASTPATSPTMSNALPLLASTSSPPPIVSTAVPSSASGSSSCVWKGHCLGDPCHTFNDCSGTDICTNGVCAPCTGGSWC